MKKRIGKFTYNTEASKLLADCDGIQVMRSRTGKYFFFHTEEKKIIPTTFEDVQAFISVHPELKIENNDSDTYTYRCSPQAKRALYEMADITGRTITDLANEAIIVYRANFKK